MAPDGTRWLIPRAPHPRASGHAGRGTNHLGSAAMHRTRFPGLSDGWARLDGAAGTQMVDDAIEEMAAWMRSGHSANHGGAFQAAERTDALVTEARASVARLLGAGAEGVVFGPSMTALTMRFAAAACRALQPGDEIVLTRLDHDANVA